MSSNTVNFLAQLAVNDASERRPMLADTKKLSILNSSGTVMFVATPKILRGRTYSCEKTTYGST
jgi:hypothetical protein